MKKIDIERLILLKQSGEISPRQSKLLKEAMLNSEIKKTSEIYDYITQEAVKNQPVSNLDELRRARILRQGQEALNKKPTLKQRPSLFAIAAVWALFLVGIVFMLNPRQKTALMPYAQLSSIEIDRQFMQVEEMLYEFKDVLKNEEPSLDQLALELLQLEDQKI